MLFTVLLTQEKGFFTSATYFTYFNFASDLTTLMSNYESVICRLPVYNLIFMSMLVFNVRERKQQS